MIFFLKYIRWKLPAETFESQKISNGYFWSETFPSFSQSAPLACPRCWHMQASKQILQVRHSPLVLSSHGLCDEWHWAPTVKTWLVLMEKPYCGRPRKPRPLILVTLLHLCSTSSHRTRLSFLDRSERGLGILHSVSWRSCSLSFHDEPFLDDESYSVNLMQTNTNYHSCISWNLSLINIHNSHDELCWLRTSGHLFLLLIVCETTSDFFPSKRDEPTHFQRQAYVQVDSGWRRRYCHAWSSSNYIFCIKPFSNKHWQQNLQASTGEQPEFVCDFLPSRIAHIQGWFTLLSRRST